MTPAPISVERLSPAISDYPGNHFEDAEPIMVATLDGEYVRHSDYAALLQQLAEREAECKQHLLRALENGAAYQAAERAREECLRLAEKWERISSTHGVRCFTGDDHLIFANELRVALGQQPAALLAASGGA